MPSATIKPTDRAVTLEHQRKLKMARSAHAYVRGNTLRFYEWLASADIRSIPDGPAIWICGDCHAGNLGPVANANGNVEIQIRDLDQTVIGNPSHDLIRLGLSLATAARGSDLPGVTTALMLEQMIEGYQESLSQSEEPTSKTDTANLGKPIELILKQAMRRRWRHLAKDRFESAKPTLPLGKRFWALEKHEMQEVKELFKEPELRRLITCLENRKSNASIEVVAAAYWMKGCSSLGRLRYAVLVQVGTNEGSDEGLCLLDIKEAVQAAAPRSTASMPRNNAARVVEGARQLAPSLGNRMLATEFLGRPVVVREILPQDMKLELERLSSEEAVIAARFLASVVGKAHARQMEEIKKQWHSELAKITQRA